MRLVGWMAILVMAISIAWAPSTPAPHDNYPTKQDFDYVTAEWNWYTTLEVIQHPEVQRVNGCVTIRGDWWVAVENLHPTDVDGRFKYKSRVNAHIGGNYFEDATGLTCELNGPFDGRLDFSGTSGRIARDIEGGGVVIYFTLDPAPFKGKGKYFMPMHGLTRHTIELLGAPVYIGFFTEETNIHLTLEYQL
jgi:hypothetical protein